MNPYSCNEFFNYNLKINCKTTIINRQDLKRLAVINLYWNLFYPAPSNYLFNFLNSYKHVVQLILETYHRILHG